MARSTGRFNRLLEIIGLVDDETDEEKEARRAGGRRVTPEDARARYGATSAGSASYDRDQRDARGGYSSSAYGSSGRAASYERVTPEPRGYSPRTVPTYDRGASSYTSSRQQGSAYDRPAYGSRADSDARRREDDELEFEPTPARRQPLRQPSAGAARRDNVVPMQRETKPQMMVYYLHTLEECRDVIKDLLERKSVLLNLEDMDDRLLQRAIDTLGGAAFALDAKLRKASDRTYLIVPANVEVAYTNDTDRPY